MTIRQVEPDIKRYVYLLVLKVLECLRKLSTVLIKMSVEKSFRDICLTGNVHEAIDYIKSGKEYNVNETAYIRDDENCCEYDESLIYTVCERGHKEVAILLAELGASLEPCRKKNYYQGSKELMVLLLGRKNCVLRCTAFRRAGNAITGVVYFVSLTISPRLSFILMTTLIILVGRCCGEI